MRAEIYTELAPHFEALIRTSARSFSKALDLPEEDVAQEARLALYLALPKYQYNKSFGKIHAFARRAVQNALCSLAARETLESRVPRIVISENGELKTVRCRPAQMDDFDLLPDEDVDLDQQVETSRWFDRLKLIEMKLMKRLNKRQKRVFNCSVRPSNELQLMARNKGTEITNQLIGEYLGLSKNSVDWALHVTKRHFTILAEKHFSDLVKSAIEERNWPLLYSSARENDLELIRGVISDRGLDPRPVAPMETVRSVAAARRIETYDWGSVILLRFGDQAATVVVEGRFNAITGEVITESGYWKSILDVVPYYKALNRALKAKEAA